MALTVSRPRPDDQVPGKEQSRATLLGQLLLTTKTITAEQLREALCQQQETGERLGEVLVRMGALTSPQLEHALELQAYLRGR